MLFCSKCQNLLDLSKSIISRDILDTNTPDTVSSNTANTKEKNDINSDNTIVAYHACTTCNYHEPIKNNTLILSKNKDQDTNLYIDFGLFKDYKYSNILPRTKNYLCNNNKCETHKNINIKEAVFFRTNSESMNTFLMCVICDTVWKL